MSIERRWDRAQRYLLQKQIDAARITLESLLDHDPTHVRAHLLLGGIAWQEDRVRNAAAYALAAGNCSPRDPELVCDVIDALIQVGEVNAARTILAKIEDLKSGIILMRLAGQLQTLGEHDRALHMLDRAGAAGVADANFYGYRGVERAFNGDLAGAEQDLSVCVRSNPTAGRMSLMLSRLRRLTSEQNHLAALERGRSSCPGNSEDFAAIEFARYKELEDLGRYEEAWDALSSANDIMHAIVSHDAAREHNGVAALVELCTASFLKSTALDDGGAQPIFVIGLPRSGTTLLDRVIGSHPQIASAGELPDFGKQLCWTADHLCPLLPDDVMLTRLRNLDYAELGSRYLRQTRWRSSEKQFYVDKLPAHWLVAGLIQKALPHARIVHLTRDAIDVCFSNFRSMFGPSYAYSYDQISMALHYIEYVRMMAHWHKAMPGQILDVSYRQLVDSPEQTAKSVWDFCGLEHELAFNARPANRAVATLSMAQVREPIHQRSFGEWRRYEGQLGPLIGALARANIV